MDIRVIHQACRYIMQKIIHLSISKEIRFENRLCWGCYSHIFLFYSFLLFLFFYFFLQLPAELQVCMCLVRHDKLCSSQETDCQVADLLSYCFYNVTMSMSISIVDLYSAPNALCTLVKREKKCSGCDENCQKNMSDLEDSLVTSSRPSGQPQKRPDNKSKKITAINVFHVNCCVNYD